MTIRSEIKPPTVTMLLASAHPQGPASKQERVGSDLAGGLRTFWRGLWGKRGTSRAEVMEGRDVGAFGKDE